jgi:hypothetical protein
MNLQQVRGYDRIRGVNHMSLAHAIQHHLLEAANAVPCQFDQNIKPPLFL